MVESHRHLWVEADETLAFDPECLNHRIDDPPLHSANATIRRRCLHSFGEFAPGAVGYAHVVGTLVMILIADVVVAAADAEVFEPESAEQPVGLPILLDLHSDTAVGKCQIKMGIHCKGRFVG